MATSNRGSHSAHGEKTRLLRPSGFIVVLAVWDVVGYLMFRHLWFGHWNVTGVTIMFWFFSIITMLVIGTLIERRRLGKLTSLKTQSWAFLIGDSIGLPLAGVMLFYVHKQMRTPLWLHNHSTLVFIITGVVGVIAGCVFHFVLDAPAYEPLALKSPTKLYHDFGAYPLFVASLVFGLVYGISGLFTSFHHVIAYFIVGLIGFGIWVVGGIHDSKPDKCLAKDQHVQYVWRDGEIIPYSGK